MKSLLLLSLVLATVLGCARAPIRGPEEAMRPAPVPELADDLPLPTLVAAIDAQIAFMEKNGEPARLRFGTKEIAKSDYLLALRKLADQARTATEAASIFEYIRTHFEFHEIFGQKGWGDVFMTSYFEPVIPGALEPSPTMSQPLYGAPQDLLELDLALFDPKFQQERKLRGRVMGNSFVPYFSRSQIDSDGALRGRKLELCWVDPIDAFFLQVQGSGTIELGAGKSLRLNYANKNGHLYESLSKHLKGVIPPEQMNGNTIEAHLRTLTREHLQKLLNVNPSYVFFLPSEQNAVTFLGVPATEGRTIATDPKYFPKGALAFLAFEKPKFSDPQALVPDGSEPASRFVLDQDIGGAIQGPGRLDLFWGRGAVAKRYAGAIRGNGKLYYLVPKQ